MRRTTRLHALLLPLFLAVVLAACSGNKNKRPDPVEPKPTGPTAEELFVKGNAKLDKGSWEAAVESYDEAIETDAEQWQYHMNRGIALMRMGKFDKALSSFELSLANGGAEQADVYFNLGNLYQERGMYSASIDAYRTSLAYGASEDVDTLVNIGAGYVFLRQYDQATATYQYVQSVAPDDPRGLHGQALVKQLQDQYQDAAALYEQVHSIDAQFPLAYFNKSRCYAAMEEYDRAVASIQQYINLAPDGPYVRRAKSMLGRYKKKMNDK